MQDCEIPHKVCHQITGRISSPRHAHSLNDSSASQLMHDKCGLKELGLLFGVTVHAADVMGLRLVRSQAYQSKACRRAQTKRASPPNKRPNKTWARLIKICNHLRIITDPIVSIKADSWRLNCTPTVSCPWILLDALIFKGNRDAKNFDFEPRTRSTRSLPRESCYRNGNHQVSSNRMEAMLDFRFQTVWRQQDFSTHACA
jgi:hypothetical protein